MTKVASEDSVRRALSAMEEAESEQWLRRHLKASYEPLLEEPCAMDIDTTVKPLYGHQEDAKVGYNPTKPGRPSHAYHSYFIANLRIVMDVEVQAGNQTASSYAQPGMWEKLDGLEEQRRPALVRGDCAWGAPAGDGRSRATRDSLPVQTEAEFQYQEVGGETTETGRVGGCWAGVGGAGK